MVSGAGTVGRANSMFSCQRPRPPAGLSATSGRMWVPWGAGKAEAFCPPTDRREPRFC